MTVPYIISDKVQALRPYNIEHLNESSRFKYALEWLYARHLKMILIFKELIALPLKLHARLFLTHSCVQVLNSFHVDAPCSS